MRTVFLWLLWVWAMSVARAVQELPLPMWKGEERKIYEAAGGLVQSWLLTDEPLADAALPAQPPEAEEVTPDPVRSSEIPERFLAGYFANRPKEYLVDPQGLLGAKDFKDRLAFLNEHARDSPIDFYVYVFGIDQEIPGEVRAEETVERLFNTGRPAVTVFYFLGAPHRSAIYLSPSLTEHVSAAEQRRALQSSVVAAFGKLGFADQMEAFSVQMAIRIYWMERMLGGARGPDAAAIEETGIVAAGRPDAVSARKEIVLGLLGKWGAVAAAGAGVAMMLLAFAGWLRSRVTWVFPELEVEPRLGGAHAAGVGAVISFANASSPPASQKDQVPDYLRRA